MSDRLDLIDRILGRNLDWVAAADGKVAPILAMDTAMLGVMAALVPSASSWRAVPAIMAGMASICLLVSLICLGAATFPRLHGPKESLVFFGGITTVERSKYVERLLAVPPQEIHEDFAEQVHRNAEIAATKFGFVRTAMVFLFAAIPFWLVAIGLLYAGR
ncbi:MAG: Pycsar system effector family protein [Longimicrobiales bacterium]